MDVAVQQQSLTLDAVYGHTEPKQCPAETEEDSSLPKTDGVAESDSTEGTATQPSPPLTPTADLEAQPAVDSQAASQHFTERNEQKLSQHAAEAAVTQQAPDETESEHTPPEDAESVGVLDHDQPAEEARGKPKAPAVDAQSHETELEQTPTEDAESVGVVDQDKQSEEALGKPQAPAADISSDNTKSERPPPEDTESPGLVDNDRQTEDTTTQSSPSVTSTANLHVQHAVDSRADSQHFVARSEEVKPTVDETVLDSESELNQPQSVDQHRLHRELVDSSVDELQAPDITNQRVNDTAMSDVEQSQWTAESDHSVDDDIVQQHEHTEEQPEQLMPDTTEAADDQNDSQQRNVDTDEVAVEQDDSVDQLATSDNVDVHVKHEGTIKTASDEQEVVVAGGKNDASGYLAPVVNLWMALDSWLISCIDSVSSSCVNAVSLFHYIY